MKTKADYYTEIILPAILKAMVLPTKIKKRLAFAYCPILLAAISYASTSGNVPLSANAEGEIVITPVNTFSFMLTDADRSKTSIPEIKPFSIYTTDIAKNLNVHVTVDYFDKTVYNAYLQLENAPTWLPTNEQRIYYMAYYYYCMRPTEVRPSTAITPPNAEGDSYNDFTVQNSPPPANYPYGQGTKAACDMYGGQLEIILMPGYSGNYAAGNYTGHMTLVASYI